MSEIGHMKYYLFLTSLVFIFFSIPTGFYFIVVYAACSTMGAGMKSFYAIGRPFHEIEEIDTMNYCGTSFGNPSSHAMNIAIWTTVSWLELFWSRVGLSSWTSRLFPLPGIFLISSITISRMYLGAHSLNQVLFGVFVGIFVACYLHFALRDHIRNHI